MELITKHLRSSVMFRSEGRAFLILVFFIMLSRIDSHPAAGEESFIFQRIDGNDFSECVSQNVVKVPVFSRKEKEYIRFTVEPIIRSMVSHFRYETEHFALSMAEILTPNNDVNFLESTSKSDALTKTLKLCCETTPQCVNKDVILKMEDFIRGYTVDSIDSSSAPEVSRSPSSMPISSSNRELHHDAASVDKPKIRSVRQIKESITITDEDIRNCASAVQADLEDDSNVFRSCHKIFNRGVWDAKADRTLDGDIKKLITLMYGGKRENLVKVLNFIDEYVPRYVRELIVSYDTIVNEFRRNDDFNLPENRPYFLRIKSVVNRIKKMNGYHYAEKYFYAKQIHKNMLENMLVNLQVIENGESISITDEDIRDCADSAQRTLLDEARVRAVCDKIFRRGIWDDKADRTLDGDIRKLISRIYDGKPGNIPRVLYFIDKYVPKIVRELVVSYDSAVNEFRRNEDFNRIVNQPYILEIRDAVMEIKDMNGDHPSEKYEDAKQIYKDMLESLLTSLKVPEGQSVPVTGDDVQDCAESAKLILGNDSVVLERCNKVFDRNSPDKKTDKNLDYDIRRLISLIYDGKMENTARVLYFVEKYVPKSVLERIVSYDAIILEFEKTDDINLARNQGYLGVIRSAVKNIKKMNGSDPSANYEKTGKVYKDMLENILEKLRVFQGESIAITNEDIRQCAKVVKFNFEDDYEVFASCSHIFNRGVWDARADQTLDGDTRKLITLIYDGKKENAEKLFSFIDKYVPFYVRERIVSYYIFITEFEKYDDFSLLRKQPYFQKLYEAIRGIKDMDGNHPAEKYALASQRHKDMLEEMLQIFNEIDRDN